MRTLGVDYGASRTGLALSDALGVTCRPLQVISERDMGMLAVCVAAQAAEHEASAIVVGLPRPLAGGTNDQMDHVLKFVECLRSCSTISVQTWDERFTTSMAERGSKSASPRDSVAACYMLQNYLDRLSADERR